MSVRAASNRAGFSLIEILVAVLIAGIIGAIAIPTYVGSRTNTKIKKSQGDAERAVDQVTSWAKQRGDFGAGLSDAQFEALLESQIASGFDWTPKGSSAPTGEKLDFERADSDRQFTVRSCRDFYGDRMCAVAVSLPWGTAADSRPVIARKMEVPGGTTTTASLCSTSQSWPTIPAKGSSTVVSCPVLAGGSATLPSGSAVSGTADTDGDGIADGSDNCPVKPNPTQVDSNSNGKGDACDPISGGASSDTDGDGVPDTSDNCPYDANASQTDTDADGKGDVCDFGP